MWTVDNNLGPNRLADQKYLDPNHCTRDTTNPLIARTLPESPNSVW